VKTEAKGTSAEKKEIEKLFKAGLEAALKDPKKFWDAENERTAKTPVSKFLASQPLVRKPSKGKGKQEALVAELDALFKRG